MIFDIRLNPYFGIRARGVAWLTCQIVDLKIAGSNPVGPAKYKNLHFHGGFLCLVGLNRWKSYRIEPLFWRHTARSF